MCRLERTPDAPEQRGTGRLQRRARARRSFGEHRRRATVVRVGCAVEGVNGAIFELPPVYGQEGLGLGVVVARGDARHGREVPEGQGIRRKLWNDARRRGQGNRAREIKGTRYVFLKGGERLSERQQDRLRQLETFNRPLYRAYLLKEELRAIFTAPTPAEGRERLGAWIEQAEASEVQEMAVLAARVRRHRAEIEASIELGQSNAKAEAANTKIRLIIRRAFGFHSAQAVIALAMLTLGGLCPPLAFA